MNNKNKILYFPFIIMGLVLMLSNNCKKDETISSKKDPIITWANPTDITYGTLLSTTQLNAIADVAGTFVYTPALGTILNVGTNQVLKVDFTPTDAATYNVASKTVKINVIGLAYGTMNDQDGNVYKTITIGTQTWMAENLKTTKYRDGTAIPNITDNTAWANQTAGAYCWYNNDIANKTTYGSLYNWYTVNTAKLAPTGWHIPTDAEWTTLTTYLGGENVAGGKMKATTLWNSPNTGADNSSGFTALPGGYRGLNGGECLGIGDFGTWWSSTGYIVDLAWGRSLHNSYSEINRSYYNYKSNGSSVRCLRDL